MAKPSCCAAAAVVLLLAAGCSTDDPEASGPSSTQPQPIVTVDTTPVQRSGAEQEQVKKLADQLLPALPSAEEAETVEADCAEALGGFRMEHSMGHEEEGTPRTGADGRYERVVDGMNPRVDVSSYPFDAEPTEEQQVAADDFVADVRQNVQDKGWDDITEALADGYRPLQQCNSHWANVGAIVDGANLDPTAPEVLVFLPDEQGANQLESVMFVTTSTEVAGPQNFGPIAVWHYHESPGICLLAGVIPPPQTASPCPAGTVEADRTSEMLHIMMEGYPFEAGM